MSKILGEIKIGNERFDFLSGEYTPQTRYWRLDSAYKRPSKAKIAIWNHWVLWFKRYSEGAYDYISIYSKNVNMFTLNGRITVAGEKYSFYISKTRQELYKER